MDKAKVKKSFLMKSAYLLLALMVILTSCKSNEMPVEELEYLNYSVEEFEADRADLVEIAEELISAYSETSSNSFEANYFDSNIVETLPSELSLIVMGADVFNSLDSNNRLFDVAMSDHDRSISRILGASADSLLDDRMRGMLSDYYFRKMTDKSAKLIFSPFDQSSMRNDQRSIDKLLESKGSLVLVLIDSWSMELPELIGDDEFSAGYVEAKVTVVDVSSKEVLFTFPIAAENSNTVSYTSYGGIGSTGGYTEIDDDLFQNFNIELATNIGGALSSSGLGKTYHFIFER
jgi:hypothetical protein